MNKFIICVIEKLMLKMFSWGVVLVIILKVRFIISNDIIGVSDRVSVDINIYLF